jgi:murein DD-endopeptidase MepM/ murein hydrolase activator NlpD
MKETYPQTHAGCGGGCISLGDEVSLAHTCNYNRHTEFAGSIREKIEQMKVVSDSYHHNNDNFSKSLKFIWPVKGRIIQTYGNRNDGINISVPLGTEVKSIEEGEVAFAGSQLSGYGNMILIRHPEGYVSVYAHNSELLVRRGDKVTFGQTIAKSGQTGNVGSPQLHFELLSGSNPLDPSIYLARL